MTLTSPQTASIPLSTSSRLASAGTTLVAGTSESTASLGPRLSAPADAEVEAYLGRQHRWVIVAMNVSTLITIVTLAQFAMRSWILYPFFVVLAVTFVGTLLALVTSVQPRRVSRESHHHTVAEYQPTTWPSVDVFLPTCGEPADVLANTYRHVAALEWPGEVSPVILDDADRPEVRDLALEFGFRYEVRPDRGHMKKAGNLAYGYAVTSSDVIAIFDADFCPRPDFLSHLVPYLADEKVGIVQSPQVFDARAEMNWLERGAGAVQELFYRFIQPSRDTRGAAICVGTSALYRRAALDANGGFTAIDHSEDVYTGLDLQRNGYELRYVPVQLSKGLAPDSTAAFLTQQYRWGLGSISLMVSPAFRRLALTPLQRMAHWAGFLFYVTTAIGALVTELPGILALLVFPTTIEPVHYLGLLPAIWVRMVLVPMVYRIGIRFDVLRVEMLFGFAHMFAVIDGVRGRAAAWVTTSSDARAALEAPGMPLARRIAITGVVVICTTIALLGFSLTSAIAAHGLTKLWMPALVALVFLYTAVPVLVALLPVAFPALEALRRPRVGSGIRSTRDLTPQIELPMAWPEACALTSVIVCVALAALFL
ncbi:glycosyltransferase family 2 protein [Microbacterium sp. NPDC016588]